LSYICWELSRRPEIMKELQRELDENIPNADQLPDMQTLQDLLYLNAVIQEGIRLYA